MSTARSTRWNRHLRRKTKVAAMKPSASRPDQPGLRGRIAVEEFVDEANVATLIPSCDAVIDAIDAGARQGRADRPLQARPGSASSPPAAPAAGSTRCRMRSGIDLVAHHPGCPGLQGAGHGCARNSVFSRDPKQKFGVECVFSPEQIRRPAAACGTDEDFDAAAGLACAGYGSSVAVTASFGFAAAARVLAGILPA
jgi:hypothetical protein